MSAVNLAQLIEDTDWLVSPPTVVEHINTLLKHEQVHWNEIARIVEREPAVAARILRVVNSPLYGLKVPVTSIPQALVYMGTLAVTSITTAVSIFSQLLAESQPEAVPYLERFWWHSTCTAFVARALAEQLERSLADQVFTAALLHDVGKLLMIQLALPQYRELEQQILSGAPEQEAERAIMGMTHEEAGHLLAQRWKLPEPLPSVIRFHSAPQMLQRFQTQAAVTRIADLLCEVWGAGIGEGISKVVLAEEPSWKLLAEKFPELEQIDLAAFTLNLEQRFREAATMLHAMLDASAG